MTVLRALSTEPSAGGRCLRGFHVTRVTPHYFDVITAVKSVTKADEGEEDVCRARSLNM